MTATNTTKITTCLWFDGNGHAAAQTYCALFHDAEILNVSHQMNPDGTKGAPFMTEFRLGTQAYQALDGGPHYALTPAASISVLVDTQAEIDRLWSALLANGGKESRCGWLTDGFGLSWQIVPRQLGKHLQNPDRAAAGRAMKAMMGMVKLDIAALDAAAAG